MLCRVTRSQRMGAGETLRRHTSISRAIEAAQKSTQLQKINLARSTSNHMQSKHVPIHVNNKAKIGHLNIRSLYPNIDDIRCIVDKTILTFIVSVKLGYIST